MRTSSMTLKAIALLTASIGLAACNDIEKATPKPVPTPSVATEAPKTPEMQPPVPSTPPPEVKKEEPIVKKAVTKEDDDSNAIENGTLTELLARTREALSTGETDRALKLAASAVKKAPKR